MNPKTLISTCLMSSLVLSASAFADGEGEEEHYDIGVWNDNGTLRTGGWDHDNETLEVANLRVFEAHFGEDPDFPFAIDEPGIGGVAADLGLPEGATLGLNLIAGLGVWNGAGFDAASTTMTVDYGPASIGSGSGGMLDFLITDDYDLHPIFGIDPASAAGSYLLEFNVQMDGYATSDSFWIVFNLGLDDEDFEESVEWVEGNLVPAPGALGVLAMAGMMGRRRRA
ncbi:MAG: hypothetical protein VX726_07950 [Planctomycetota bacterium]|nr:hypothetical protein [Planctomycetota bacterium]